MSTWMKTSIGKGRKASLSDRRRASRYGIVATSSEPGINRSNMSWLDTVTSGSISMPFARSAAK
ncbi:hypothetical protein AJ88_31780 [Mesorhizobium amorphae CCBAU 01583]|nr:hypothetical protein AJ88_31780 [Mesorhizobium amorphae CCBAU 01583]